MCKQNASFYLGEGCFGLFCPNCFFNMRLGNAKIGERVRDRGLIVVYQSEKCKFWHAGPAHYAKLTVDEEETKGQSED
jgi:hypothetical protein